jgi:hypothetical protein
MKKQRLFIKFQAIIFLPLGALKRNARHNYLVGDEIIKVWDQEICFSCVFKFELCGC